MSKRAEQRALEAYPKSLVACVCLDESIPVDINSRARNCYQEGYEQAEKDIIALIESRLSEILGDAQPKPALRAELQELIDKIKEGTK